MDWGEIIKIVGPALALGGAVVAITRYVTRLQDQIEFNSQQQELKLKINQFEQDATLSKTQHELELKEANAKLDILIEQKQKTEQNYLLLLESGSAIAALKKTIDNELVQIADRLGATAYSILVPSPSVTPDDTPDSLIFLNLFPENPKLRNERISLDSVAGRVLRDRQSLITRDPISAGGFSGNTDEVSGFTTANMLVTPLFCKGRCVGVAEFLNKRNQLSFDPIDRDSAEEAAGVIGPKVGDFTADARNLKSLGFTPRQKATDATILVSDLTNSSNLASKLDPAAVIDLMNQYMETLCEVGMRHGGTVDQLLGDGFLMTFNVKRPLDAHQSAAMDAAFEMQDLFHELKKKWMTLKYPGMDLVFNRIGMTSGPVRKAELGPPQFRQITVMGEAVNTASRLCQVGSRDKNVIVVGKEFYSRLPLPPAVVEISFRKMGSGGADKAFEVTRRNGQP
jgi:class 3 adenylate cyclase